jgi:tripartite-type tricarboxylate transporter receptor subunit TctC
MNMQRRNFLNAVGTTAITFSLPAFAQTKFPSRPITFIVPFAPGGTTDIIARIVAEPMGKLLGQTIVVDNRGGGGGTIGAIALRNAAPDGHTLGIATVSTMATNPAVNPNTGYNPLDFVPITNLASTPNVLAVNSQFPAKNLSEFLELVRKNPGKFAFVSSGTGGVGHLMGEIFKDTTKTFITHLGYRGAGPALNDVIANQVPILFDNLPSSLPHIQSGRLRALAVASPKRVPQLPDVPTFAEAGLTPVNDGVWYGIIGPKDTPAEVVKVVHEAALKTLQIPEIRQRIIATTSEPIGNTPAQFAKQIQSELDKYKRIVQSRKIVLE